MTIHATEMIAFMSKQSTDWNFEDMLKSLEKHFFSFCNCIMKWPLITMEKGRKNIYMYIVLCKFLSLGYKSITSRQDWAGREHILHWWNRNCRNKTKGCECRLTRTKGCECRLTRTKGCECRLTRTKVHHLVKRVRL